MKVLYSPQFNNEKKLKYYFWKSKIKVEESIYVEEENGKESFELSNTLYFDISNIESGKFFKMQYPITEIKITDEELNMQLLNFIKDDASEEERFPKWQEVQFEDFEIPEDAEIIQLEELVMPEPEPSPVDALARENEELKRQLQLLQTQTDFNKQNSDMMMMELIGMINSVI